jgi:quercetin dioxygenase-like cupin family protein
MDAKHTSKSTEHIKKMAQLFYVDSIYDAAGVETLEGKIGPIISGNKGSAHYITMPAGMYLAAHFHSTESIIFTSKGDWVLCSEGERRHMKEGSLFFMPPDVETGYEVPFDMPATILIIKFEGKNNPDEFLEYLEGLKDRLIKRHAEGESFLLSELEAEHPARKFQESLNRQHP